jgi:CDP-diacylglycerol--glycerol-3-phosphate 3-phosphatidyltransferase
MATGRWEYPEKWNGNIRVLPHDRLLAATFIRLIPSRIHPNHLTILRFLLTPLVLWFLGTGRYGIGVPLFLLVAFTDALDGSLARVRRQISEWGILYDPVADKLFVGSVLAVIVLKHINLALGLTLIAFEAAVIAVGWVRLRRGIIEPANIWGKIKMIFEVTGIFCLLLAVWFQADLLMDISVRTFILALIFAIVSVLVRLK